MTEKWLTVERIRTFLTYSWSNVTIFHGLVTSQKRREMNSRNSWFEPAYILVGFLYLILGSFFVATVSCRWGEYYPVPDRKIENISRIFMHKPSQYSIVYGEDNTKTSRILEIDWVNPDSIKIVTDVAENEKMWAKLKTEEAVYSEFGKPVKKNTRYLEVEFHLHSIKNIDSGEWVERRSRGSTRVIE